MKLYTISQQVNNEYDTYDSAVVCAEDEDDARYMHPDNGERILESEEYYYLTWITIEDVDKVEVTYLGEAHPDVERGVIVASFNAG